MTKATKNAYIFMLDAKMFRRFLVKISRAFQVWWLTITLSLSDDCFRMSFIFSRCLCSNCVFDNVGSCFGGVPSSIFASNDLERSLTLTRFRDNVRSFSFLCWQSMLFQKSLIVLLNWKVFYKVQQQPITLLSKEILNLKRKALSYNLVSTFLFELQDLIKMKFDNFSF